MSAEANSPYNAEYARERDRLADDIDRARAVWHIRRNELDAAQRDLRQAIRAEMLAEQQYRAAHAAYEAHR